VAFRATTWPGVGKVGWHPRGASRSTHSSTRVFAR